MIGFVLSVFRPKEIWARVLAALMTATLWIGWGVYVAQGGLVDATPNSAYWVAFSAIGLYPIWISIESFRYWTMMRKRHVLGLADPILVDRFRVWAIASASAAASIWIVNLPMWLGVRVGGADQSPIASFAMIATACFGMVTVTAYWLTFFPPQWYRSRLATAPSPPSESLD